MTTERISFAEWNHLRERNAYLEALIAEKVERIMELEDENAGLRATIGYTR